MTSDPFTPNLYACWHPVAYAHEVTDKPRASKLLGEMLVIWRSSDGKPHGDYYIGKTKDAKSGNGQPDRRKQGADKP